MPPAPYTPSCPRCRYDLSGIAASWERARQCPLRGTCPECGASFPWSDRFTTPEQRARAAHFEFTPRPTLRALLRTALLTLRPSRFWLGPRSDDPVRPRRLVPLALFGTLAAYVAVAIPAATIQLAGDLHVYLRRLPPNTSGVRFPFPWDIVIEHARGCLLPFGGFNFDTGLSTALSAPIAFALAAFLLAPLALRLLPRDFRACDPGWPALARVWACGLIPLPLALGLDVLLSTALHTLGYAAGASGLGMWSYLYATALMIMHWHGPIAAALILAWTFLWWRTALAGYLGSRAPARVAAAIILTGILIALAIAMIPPQARAWLTSSI